MFSQRYDVCLSRTVPARSTDSPAATSLPLFLVLLLPEGAPVIAVSPCELLPPWTSGTRRLFKTRTSHFPPQRLLKATLTSEDRREGERDPYWFADNCRKIINPTFHLHTSENNSPFSIELAKTKLANWTRQKCSHKIPNQTYGLIMRIISPWSVDITVSHRAVFCFCHSYRSSQLWLRCISRTVRPKPTSASSLLLW